MEECGGSSVVSWRLGKVREYHPSSITPQGTGGAGKEELLGLTWLSLMILRQVEVHPGCEGLNMEEGDAYVKQQGQTSFLISRMKEGEREFATSEVGHGIGKVMS